MTASVFFGCTFIAFGPAIALFLFTIAREPLRVIFLIAGAFFWLVSLLLSSLVWFISVQISNKDSAVQQKGLLIFGVVLSVLLQETFRFAYYKLLKKANEGLLALSQEETMPISIRQLAYVSGLGFGFMSGAFSVVNILADSVGPGTVGIHGDSQHYFLSSAFMTMAIILLHMFWGVVFFDACEKQRWWAVAAVVISHLVVSCRCVFRFCVDFRSPPSPADLSEPRVRRQPRSHLRHLAPDGRVGVLLCRRLAQEPQTLPDLQRQGLPARQPPAQITQHAGQRAGLCPKIPGSRARTRTQTHTQTHTHTHNEQKK